MNHPGCWGGCHSAHERWAASHTLCQHLNLRLTDNRREVEQERTVKVEQIDQVDYQALAGSEGAQQFLHERRKKREREWEATEQEQKGYKN